MDFNTDLGQATKLGARLTVLAMAVALAACGGGGASDAVKAPTNNNGGGTNQPAASQYALTLSTDKPSLKISGDTVTITATALEKIGGGRVAGQTVQLVLPNAIKNGLSIAGASKVETNDLGQAVFVLQLTPNSNAEQQALLTKGLDVEVVLVEANGAEVRQRTVLNVVQPGTQISAFNLDIFTNKQVANVNGDTIAVTLRVSDSNTGGIAGQRVILGIPNGLRGVLIDGASESVTDGAGNAIFSVKIAEKLTAAEITELLKGISLVARLVDSTGAEKLQNRLLTAARPTAQYNLAIQSSAPNLNVFGDEVTLSVQASAIAGASVAGQSITVALATGTPAGVQLDGNTTALTNEQGVAQFRLKLVAGLSQQAINALLAQPLGLGIGATLTERSGAQTSTALVIPVVKPSIQNTIRLDVTKNALVATGDTMQVIATVLDKNNGAVAGQRVTLKLEATNGVSIEGAATIQTDAKGLAVFNIRLNDKLSVAEREALVNIGIKATATLVEASGASIATPTRTIVVSQPGSNPLQSIYTAEIGLSKAVVSRNGDTVTVTVRAKDKNGGGVKDQQITLGLPNGIKGVVIDGSSTQMTDDKGLASFVLQISNQVDVSDIALNVTLVEQNGAIATANKTLKVEAPVATLTPSMTLSRNSISVDGGAVDVTVRAVNASGGSVAGQKITLSLPTNTTAAVIDGDSVLTTNAQGIAVFRVLVKAGVSPQSIGLGAVITEASGAISPAALASIVVENPAADYKLGLSVSGQLNVFGGQVEIVAKMSSQYGASIAGKSVTLGLPSLPAGLTIDRTTTTTNAAGEARFTLTAAPNLSTAAQDKLLAEGLALTALFNQSASVQIQAPVLQVAAVRPAAQYQLSLTSSKSRVDVFGDSFVVTAQASNVQGGDVEGQAVTLTLAPQVNGIAIQGASTVRTNAQGQAQFVVSIAGLSVADRQKLVAESLQLNARLVEVTGASVSASTAVVAQAVLPDFYPEISLGQDQVSTQGAAIDVFVRVRNDAGASFAGQSTLLQISGQDGKPINGLVVDGAATAVSNEQGVARYRVLVPKGVAPQSLIVAAVVFSANGSVSTPATTSIIVSQPQAEYQLALSADNDQVSVYGDQIRVRVQASNVLGSTESLANQTVRLGIPTLSGVEIVGGATALTDTNGVALFTINVGQLSQTARAELLKTNLPISAVLVQSNGIQIAAPTTLVRAIEPESSLFAEMTLANNPISTDGGTVAVTVRARDVQGGGVANQRVSLSLPLAVRSVVIDGASTVVTDAQGNARFNVTVPAGTAPQSILVSAVVIEANGSSSQSSSSSIEIQSKQSLYTLALSTDKQRVNVFGDSFTVVATTTATSGSSVVGQRIALDLPSMAGLTAQASNNSLTNQRGEVTFTVQLSELSETDRASLLTGNLSLKATLLQTNGVQIAAPLLALQTQAPAAELTPTISFSKPTLSANGDTVTVSVRAADAKGGAVAGQTIDLMIDDGFAVAQIDGASRVVTGANGVATFTVKVSKTDPRDISVRARLTQPNGANVLSAPAVIRAEAPVSQYQLSLSADKVRLNVLGDTVRVTAQATNTVGGGVAGQPVTLTIAPQLTGIAIQGASTVETDDRGQAVFEISLAKLSVADQQTLLASGLGLTAVLREANGAAAVAPIRTLPVEVLIPEYYPEISLSQNQLTPAGGVVDVFVRVRNSQSGAVANQTTVLTVLNAAGQPVKGLVIEEVDPALSGDDNDTQTAVTNNQGVSRYRVVVPNGIAPQSLSVKAVAVRQGALVERFDETTIVVASPQAMYTLSSTPSRAAVNGYSDTFEVRLQASSAAGRSLAGQLVSIGLPRIDGVSIQGAATAETDVNGSATFTINISGVSAAGRLQLANEGLPIAALLVQSDGVRVPAALQNIQVEFPQSALFAEITNTSSVIFSEDGGTAQIQVRARDINGGGVAGQTVQLNLPAALRGVVIDGASSAQTDAQGVARFSVVVPVNTPAGAVPVTATVIEPNGALSAQSSTSISVQSKQSLYMLALRSSKPTVNVFGDSVTVVAAATALSGAPLAGQRISFDLPNITGLTAQASNGGLTNQRGEVTFTVSLNGLNEADRNGLLSGNLALSATLLQSNGVRIPSSSLTLQAEAPIAALTPQISFSKQTLSANGDEVTVSVRAANSSGGSVAGQTIDLSVEAGFAAASITGASSAVTDASGIATFVLKVNPTTLTEIGLSAVLTQPNGASRQNTGVIAVVAPVSQYRLSIQSDKSRLNVLGDTLLVTTQATNVQGGQVEDQPVTLMILPEFTGISIQGASTVRTNAQGQAQFIVSIAGLSATDRAALVNSGLALTAKLSEANGATRTATQSVTAFEPTGISSLNLALRSSQPQINIFGDQIDVTVLASTAQGIASAGQAVTIGLPALAGLTLTGAPTVTTNATGQATFSLTLSSTLSAAERAALLANGLPIAATLAEANGATKTINQTIAAFEPTASYQLSLVSSASPLNARGGTATIRVQVLDQDLRAVANRPVKVWLSSANNSAGLLSLNGQPANLLVDIQTNAQGIAEYQIAIPTGLTATQRSNLLQGVTANAIVTEQSGARNVFTQLLSVAEPTSSLVLGLQANKASINAASSDSFDVIVSLRDAENRAVSGQQLSFALSDIALRLGVTVAANTVNTDANGSAKFTVTTPVGLDVAALNGLLSYAVSLSAANGAIVTQTGMIAVVQPTARYALRLNADKIVKTSGDTFKVFAQAVDDAGNSIANQRVQLLVNDPIRTGVTVTGGAEIVTDANGLAVFDLTLTPGANVNQLFLSSGIGLTARLNEDTGVQSRQALIVPVDTLNTTGQYRLSWTQSKSAFTGFGDEIAVTYRVTDANGGILAGVPVALKIQDALISGATLTTSSRLVTDANGLITTTVRLTGRDLDAVIGSNVVVVVAEVQAASFNAQGAPTVTTLASQSISLSKGGGAAFTLQSSLSVMRAGESTLVTAKLVDADGVPVANAPVEFVDELTGLAFALGALSTGPDGMVQARLAFSQLSFGADGRARITAVVRGSASELRTAEAVEIVSASDALFSFITLPNNVSSVDTAIPVTLRVRASSAAELNGELVLNTSLGRVSTSASVAPTSNQVRVLLDGTVTGVEGTVSYRDVTVFVSSSFPGTAVLTGTYQRANQAIDRVVADIRLRAVTPAKLMLQADQTVLVPNQSTRVVAIVKDANDSPVSGAVVRFERLVDTSAGRLSSATATTNDAGIAAVTYTAGTSAPLDRIEINAIVESNPAIRPQPGVLTLTVSQQAAYITVGNSDRLRASTDNIYYYHPYSMAVVDGSGRPVPNQAVSVQLFASEYAKGFWRLVAVTINGIAMNVWVRSGTYQECDTEDQNRNFTLDSGEDLNGNGRIEAANPVAIIAGNDIPADANGVVTFVSDAEGKFDFQVRYPKIYAEWMSFEMKATTRVFGSELASVTLQNLPVSADDVTTTEGGIRPNINSPFGTVLSCNSPD